MLYQNQSERVQRRPSPSALNLKFQQRDYDLLASFPIYDGVLAEWQVARLFFSSERQAQRRLARLFHAGYIKRLPYYHSRVYLREEKAVIKLAEKAWQERRWQEPIPPVGPEEPEWVRLPHHLAVNDVRIDLLLACQHDPRFHLIKSFSDAKYKSLKDNVIIPTSKGDKRCLFNPDLGVSLTFTGQRRELPFFVFYEVDRGSMRHKDAYERKFQVPLAYKRSDLFKKHWGVKAGGKWAFITTDEKRIQTFQSYAKKYVGKAADLFYFTTFKEHNEHTALTAPIWYRGLNRTKEPLFIF